MTRLVSVFLFSVMTHSAWARVGDTEEQLTARLGSAGSPVVTNQPWCTTRVYIQHGYKFQAYLIDHVSVAEEYQMVTPAGAPGAFTNSPSPIPLDHVQTLLDINAQGHHWTASDPPKAAGTSNWTRDDGATAVLIVSYFYVELPAYAQAKAAYQKSLEPSVKGF